MRRLRLISIVAIVSSISFPVALAQSIEEGFMHSLEGVYERIGVVDHTVETQFKGLGLVLVPPVSIDELLVCPKRRTSEDFEFVVKKQDTANYEVLFPKANVTCSLTELGTLVEASGGSIALSRLVTLTGEGHSSIHGDRLDQLSKELRDGVEWLVVETRIEWEKRSLFRSKKMEYRSLVRFRFRRGYENSKDVMGTNGDIGDRSSR